MSLQISYMGTKKWLANQVAHLIKQYPEGIFLDAFSGMCSVGQALDGKRNLWTNDIQKFPSLVGKILFCSKGPFPNEKEITKVLMPYFNKNYKALEGRFITQIAYEEKHLKMQNLEEIIMSNCSPYVGNDPNLENERKRLSINTTEFPYRLFAITFAGSYFGLKQSVEIDSIRYAIDIAESKDEIDNEIKEWLIVALGQAISKVNNSTGHFAHYLRPKSSNINRIITNRKKSVWIEFIRALSSIKPLRTKLWRSKNKSFGVDTFSLLEDIIISRKKPAIIYADPPYSEAQYSRYYHIFETLLMYDYPLVNGVGRYRNGRYQTPFANVGTVIESMTSLLNMTSQIEAILILSYPGNGVLQKAGINIMDLLNTYYKKVHLEKNILNRHSTFGGRWAKPKVQVNECLYIAHQ